MGAGTTDGVRQFLSNVRYLGQIVLDTIIVDRYKYVPAEVTYDEVNFEKNRDSLPLHFLPGNSSAKSGFIF